MDFSFSEEQAMLREQVRSYLADRFPLERVAELADGDRAWDPSSWSEMAELGWTSLSVPADAGGAGMGFVEEAVLFEELGYALYPGPYFATVALALPALSGEARRRVVEGEAAATLAWVEPGGCRDLADAQATACEAKRADGSWALTGNKDLIVDLHAATEVVVVARADDGIGLFRLLSEADERRTSSTMDATRRYGSLGLSGAEAEPLVSPDDAPEVLARIRARALAAAAVEAVGVAQRALELAVAHARERRQFDKPIGSYQAVSHQIADAYMECELARSLAYWAAWSVAEGTEPALAASTAKAFATHAAVGACERAIQVHGGIGFTWEHALHRCYKRAQWLESFEGYPAVHRREVAGHILDS